jgi:hypothetical protein
MSTPTTFVDATPEAGGGQPPAGPGTALSNAAILQHRPRVGAWARSALGDVIYAGAVFAWSILAFTVLVTGLAVTASLLVLVVGVVVWIGFVYAMRWTTWVDRRLAGWQRREPLAASYRRPPASGIAPFVRTLTTDPQTWRDMAWLALTSVVGFASGLAVVTAIGVIGAYLSMPLWYWAVEDPTVHFGLTNVGLLTVDSLGRAAIMTSVGLVLIPFGLLLARACVALHVRLAVLLLDGSSDASVPR